jgi:hypothetical protein
VYLATEKDEGSMNFASKTAPVASTTQSRVAAIQGMLPVLHALADVRLEPMPIELLGGYAELDDEVPGEVLQLDLTAFLLP